MSQIRRRMAETIKQCRSRRFASGEIRRLMAETTIHASRERNTIYELLRTKLSKNYAKQTQFPKKSNERK